MSEGQTLTNERKGGKKRGIAIVVLIAVIAVLAGVIIYLLMPKDEEKRNVVVTKDNVDEIIEQMAEDEGTEAGYYTVTMNNEWHFKSGTDASYDAVVENSEMNTNDVYFDLFTADDESNVIYKSPVIPLGASLENITLDIDLDPGTYDCICEYHLVDEDQNTVSTLRVTVTVIIEG